MASPARLQSSTLPSGETAMTASGFSSQNRFEKSAPMGLHLPLVGYKTSLPASFHHDSARGNLRKLHKTVLPGWGTPTAGHDPKPLFTRKIIWLGSVLGEDGRLCSGLSVPL